MSRIVVARILWKEFRTQRSLWLGVTCLIIGLQVLVTAITLYNRNHSHSLEELYASTFVLAYIGATAYAIGSGAASFTEESEGNTAVLLRTVPMTPSEAFAGKWTFGIASAGILYLVLFVAAAICSAIASLAIQENGDFVGLVSPRFLPAAAQIDVVLTAIWIGSLIPVAFFAFCALYSLLISNGLIAAMYGTFTTILVLALMASIDGKTASPTEFALQLSLIDGALVVIDFWLTGIWFRQGTLVRLQWTGRWPVEWTGKSKWHTLRIPGPIELLRFGEPVVSWKRAAQRFVWKEIRQVRPYVGIGLLAATALAFPPILEPQSQFLGHLAPWIAGLAVPLMMGVGAYHVDQKGRAYRFLADHALTPDGSWIIKHVVWIGLTFAVCAYTLVIDRAVWEMSRGGAFRFQDSILFGIGRSVGRPALRTPNYHFGLQNSMGAVTLYTVLAYSIGQRLSFALTKGLLAFGMATGATVVVCKIWAILAARGVPLWWTIVAIPAALLAYTWAHTARWQTQQLYSYRLSLVAAWLMLPLAGIVAALCLYWPFPFDQ